MCIDARILARRLAVEGGIALVVAGIVHYLLYPTLGVLIMKVVGITSLLAVIVGGLLYAMREPLPTVYRVMFIPVGALMGVCAATALRML